MLVRPELMLGTYEKGVQALRDCPAHTPIRMKIRFLLSFSSRVVLVIIVIIEQ